MAINTMIVEELSHFTLLPIKDIVTKCVLISNENCYVLVFQCYTITVMQYNHAAKILKS